MNSHVKPHSARSSMLERMVEVLDLYSDDTVTLNAEEIAARMNISRPTAFRYVRELTKVGFLTKLAGRYALGARIIELDYRIRRSDPILLASRSSMRELTELTSCTTLLFRIYGDEMINIHEERGLHAADVTFGRGQPLPVFRGAPKIVLAHLGKARLRRLYERHRDSPDVRTIAADFDEFQHYFDGIRARGYYVSRGEVDAPVTGIGAPVFAGNAVVAGLALVFNRQREQLVNEQGLIDMARDYAARISRHTAEAIVAKPRGAR